jgi:hypothetical protein
LTPIKTCEGKKKIKAPFCPYLTLAYPHLQDHTALLLTFPKMFQLLALSMPYPSKPTSSKYR